LQRLSDPRCWSGCIPRSQPRRRLWQER